MKFLAIEKPDQQSAISDEMLAAEAKQVYQLQMDGIIREIYFNDRNLAVLILECSSLDQATLCLNSLPLVEENLIAFEVMSLQPYNGYSRLME